MSKIPDTVKGAINQRLFAISKGATNQQPTIIGRVILGNPDYAVIAVMMKT